MVLVLPEALWGFTVAIASEFPRGVSFEALNRTWPIYFWPTHS